MHRFDWYIGPSFFVVTFILGLFYWTNYKVYSLPSGASAEKRILMKPNMGPGTTAFSRYYTPLRKDRSQAVEFVSPITGRLCVGRVMATQGMTVEIKEGLVRVNGEELQEPYLKSARTTPSMAPTFVPYKCIFVLLDGRSNRGASGLDSRFLGPIPEECVTRFFNINNGSWRKSKGGK